MAEQPSEPKEFDASRRKLRKMREKGQFPQSRDLSVAFSSLAAVIYLLLAGPLFYDAFAAIFDAAFRAIPQTDAQPVVQFIWLDFATVLFLSVPLYGVIIISAALSTGLMGGGLRFSVDPLLPKFEKINPVAGFKRLFGKKGWSNFLMAIVKLAAYLVILTILIAWVLGDLVKLGVHLENAVELLFFLLRILVATIVLSMLVVAVIDLLIQRSIFFTEAKMTRTEKKNEDKEQEGDPMLRSRRRELANEAVNNPTGPGLATFAVQHGQVMVAYRWIEGETPVPVLVAKTVNAEGVKGIKKGMSRRAPILRDPLASRLVSTNVGSPVLQRDINDLATLMSKNNLY